MKPKQIFKIMVDMVMTALFILTAFTACTAKDDASTKSEPKSTQEKSETILTQESKTEDKILIAYFSLVSIVPEEADAVTYATPSVGNTEFAAVEIQRQVGGDLFAIQTVQNYPVSHKECSAVADEEIRFDARPELATHVEDMDEYGIVYIGYAGGIIGLN